MADQDKRFPATPHKKSEARRRGQVAKSAELNTAVVLLGGFMLLKALGGYFLTSFKELMYNGFSYVPTVDFTMGFLTKLALSSSLKFLMIIGPFIAAIGIIVVLVNFLQVGFKPSTFVLKPQWERINPLAGFKRFFSPRAFVELFKSFLKIFITGWVCYTIIRDEQAKLVSTFAMEPGQSLGLVSEIVFSMVLKVGLTLAGLAVLDYLYQRWDFEKSLRMSREELKEEMIRYEGRPEIKQRVRALQRQYATRRMIKDVPKADVVVTNPTHLAVAIQYDPKYGSAPRVVAKGSRLLAQKIIEVAKEHGVPVVENKPLARSLYKLVEIGKMIPLDMYQAVAEVLAYLYRLGKVKKKWA